MSELILQNSNSANFRWRLLASVSAVTLMISAAVTQPVDAAGTDRPTVWIELGGQLERVDGGLERFSPDFVSQIDTSVFISPIDAERPPRYAGGLEGKISFQPEDSRWVLSASVRYGRSNSKKLLHQESPVQMLHSIVRVPLLGIYYSPTKSALTKRYTDTHSRNDESHTVLDFQVGKDVGVGLLGQGSTSVLSSGIRIAQFVSKSTALVGADPDFHVVYDQYSVLPPPLPPFSGYIRVAQQYWHVHRANADIARDFHGIGPSISWNASASVAGNAERISLEFNWGVNAAVLFGRQKVVAHHATDGSYVYKTSQQSRVTFVTLPHQSHSTARSHSVVVPNVGGFAGVSLKFPNAKMSLGYRADFFFGAVDGGIDARKIYDRSFYGPFATISVGLGG